MLAPKELFKLPGKGGGADARGSLLSLGGIVEGVVSLSSSRQVFSACEKRGGGGGWGQTHSGVFGVADLEKRREGRRHRQGGRKLLFQKRRKGREHRQGGREGGEEEGEGYRQGGRGLLGAHH